MTQAESIGAQGSRGGAESDDACARVRGLLVPFIDGEATPSERSEVEAHLTSCPVCARELRAERRLRAALLRAIPRPGALCGEEARGFVAVLRARTRRRAVALATKLLAAAAAAILVSSLLHSWLAPAGPRPEAGPAPDLLAHLEILEDLQAEGLEPTAELLECILEIAASGGASAHEGDLVGLDVFDLLLEEEIALERL